MAEFLSMTRLCSIIADSGENSIFKELARRGYSDCMKLMTAETKAEMERKGFKLGPEKVRLVDGFLESLKRLRVCILGKGAEPWVDGLVEEGTEEGKGLQMRILQGLEGAARTVCVSPVQG